MTITIVSVSGEPCRKVTSSGRPVAALIDRTVPSARSAPEDAHGVVGAPGPETLAAGLQLMAGRHHAQPARSDHLSLIVAAHLNTVVQ